MLSALFCFPVATVTETEKALAEGSAVVIGLQSTGELSVHSSVAVPLRLLLLLTGGRFSLSLSLSLSLSFHVVAPLVSAFFPSPFLFPVPSLRSSMDFPFSLPLFLSFRIRIRRPSFPAILLSIFPCSVSCLSPSSLCFFRFFFILFACLAHSGVSSHRPPFLILASFNASLLSSFYPCCLLFASFLLSRSFLLSLVLLLICSSFTSSPVALIFKISRSIDEMICDATA